jgi:hypothetical protein
MSRCVGEDEPALRRRKITPRNVDGDPLLAFGTQTVGDEREIGAI